MAIDIRATSYVPTIFLRNAELQAVAELPDSAKDILTPIFCLKPWKTAKLLEAAIVQIGKAFGDREYFLDIDPFEPAKVKLKETRRPAQDSFLELVDHSDNNQSWVDFFDKHPRAYPCIQVNHGDLASIRNQIDEFTKREKPFLVRLDYGNGQRYSDVIQEVCNTEHSNFGFVLDAGWSRDLLSRTNWVDGLVKQIVVLRGDDIPIAVTGSSFPDSFSGVDLGATFQILERQLFQQLQQNNNRARLVYGDWASSRSPSEGGGGGNPIPPRIDLATGSEWESFRCREEDGGFKDAAEAASNSKRFPKGLHIWATYMIEATALGDPNGIRSLHKATAVRINMHLYRQLHYANFNPAPDTDDEYPE
ncbi:beta family protein [Albidovulum sediminis]|uniref:Beta family protein n=1 Tax=Albidovulum sediminis TaxID=3066345 RepID=A0ABT2NG78_9RHOB|nr:beta family protein [Defluviimonas sediminis]MCT8327924.1 beta family protein [Defluviimonas sediminis]